MINKTSKELRQIFDLNRDDMRYYTDPKHGVLKPEKSGKGQADNYSETDIERLLDIKIYRLSGYGNKDMGNIFTESYDSDEEIAEQIKVYKRRILILEFIQKLRSNLREAKDYISEQSVEAIVSTVKALDSYGYEIKSFEDIYELFLDMIKLIFIVDYLSQKESIKDRNEIKSLNRSKEAFDLMVTYSELFGKKITPEGTRESLTKMIIAFEEGDLNPKSDAKQLADLISNKRQAFKRLMRKIWNRNTKEWDVRSGRNYVERMMIMLDFVLDYFADEDTIYCLLKNTENFLRGLDRIALEGGEVKLPKNKVKDLYA